MSIPTETGLTEILSDDLPILHEERQLDLRLWRRHWMNFPSGENSALVVITHVLEGVLPCMMRVEEGISHDSYNRTGPRTMVSNRQERDMRSDVGTIYILRLV